MANISLKISLGTGIKQITAEGITTSFLSSTKYITSDSTFDCKVGASLTLTATTKSGYSEDDVTWRVNGSDKYTGETFEYTTDEGRDGIIIITALILSDSGGGGSGGGGDEGSWDEYSDTTTFKYFSTKTEGSAKEYYLGEYVLNKIAFLSEYQGSTITIIVSPTDTGDSSEKIYMALYWVRNGFTVGEAPYFDSETGYWIDEDEDHWLASSQGRLYKTGRSISATIPSSSSSQSISLELHLRTYGSSDGYDFPVNIDLEIDKNPDWTINKETEQGLQGFTKFSNTYNLESYNIYTFSVYNNTSQDATIFLKASSNDGTSLLGYVTTGWAFSEKTGVPDNIELSDNGTSISFNYLLDADNTSSLIFWVRCKDADEISNVTITITTTLTGWRKVSQVYVRNSSSWQTVNCYITNSAGNQQLLTPYIYVGQSVT